MQGPFISTYTRKKIHFGKVSPADICIEDIAHSLAHLCRYTGHTRMFYSVAQHSLLVAEKIPGGSGLKLAALLHDAAEAYIGDVSSPLKQWLRNQGNFAYRDLHDTLDQAIGERYHISPSQFHCTDVKLYDRAAQVFEAEAFMGLSLENLDEHNFSTALRELWQLWDPLEFAAKNSDLEFGQVEAEFIQRFETLMKAIGREELI